MKPNNKKFQICKKLDVFSLILCAILYSSCEKFVDVDPPNNQLIGEEVFDDVSTVNAAFANIYSQLRDNAIPNGGISGLSYLMGHYTDELTLYNPNFPGIQNFANNSIIASDDYVRQFWDSSYNLIYAANRILEGVQTSTLLPEGEKERFVGEAYFLRAYIHFYLTNLFGAVPYIESTDYILNSNVTRLDEEIVYQKIIADLLRAQIYLPENDYSPSHFRPNYWTASALLSRTYLYHEDWQLALDQATNIISNSNYTLNSDLGQVFLKDSNETLWQLDSGLEGDNTQEASTFIFVSGPPPNSALSDYLINDFDPGDLRFSNWVGSVSEGTETWWYANKYKLYYPTDTTEEYSVLFRLAELYLIAGEANARLGNISEALIYINTIRDRASLLPISTTDQNAVLDAILHERRIEFFTEQGHRFFDLKRTGSATSVLSSIKPNWQSTDVMFPIPESELILNPNLQPQNVGY